MKKQVKEPQPKLSLKKEAVHVLTKTELEHVVGAGGPGCGKGLSKHSTCGG